MNLLLEFIDSVQYVKEYLTIKSEAENARAEFLSRDFCNSKKGHRIEFLKQIAPYFTGLALFPDDKIINKFNKLGFKSKWLQWYIPLDDLMDEADKIMASRQVRVYKSGLLIFVKWHVQIKNIGLLSEWFDLMTIREGNEIPMAQKMIEDLYRRRNYAGGGMPKTIKDEGDLSLNKKISEYESKFGDPKSMQSEILKSARGDTSWILNQMMECFEPIKEIDRRKFSRLVYEFFRLIMKDDPQMLSYDEYLAKGPRKSQNFNKYQHSVITNKFFRNPHRPEWVHPAKNQFINLQETENQWKPMNSPN